VYREEGDRTGTTVLVADDDAGFGAVLAGLLADEGYAVVQASSGTSALEQLRQSPSGLVVLLDLHMPRRVALTCCVR
jgi:CheY-like chemotaxis protein